MTSARGPYDVIVGAGLLGSLPRLLADRDLDRSVLVVSCPPVWRRYARRIGGLRRRAGVMVMGDGERAKTLRTAAAIYDACVRHTLDRAGTVVALGGGVVGDVGGFAAATYLRGVNLVQVPTTLLAQVDSAIGGKVAVNLPAGKNLVGAFHSPSLVVCDPDALATLPAREFRAGLYEVVKYGVLGSAALFGRLERQLPAILARDTAVLTPLIAECCRIKADIVQRDERESGPRRALNFGHTIGHALEAITAYRRFKHGEAVAHGMRAAAWISMREGTLSAADGLRLDDLLDRLGRLPPVSDLKARDALATIGRDKKVVAGRLHFVLADGLGATRTTTRVSSRDLAAALRAIGLRA
ncbi:MAG TPA: 3-dehydroquinate synthase [Vicinamibacterales bacterium]|nr:3-dehydroquinate synthase [Vicinamibacterales bacterium]